MFAGRITNVPHVPRARALLDSRAMIRNPLKVFEGYRAEFGPTFSFHFGGARGVLVSTDPDLIQHVLQRNSGNYHMSDIRVERMAEFQGRGLLNSHGEAWLQKRRFLAQGFHRSRLAELLPLQVQLMEESLIEVDREAERGPLDMYRVLSALTFRLVGKSLFGSRMKDEEIERLGWTILTIQAFMVRQIVQPYKIPWFRLIGESRRHQRLRAAGERIVRDYIEARREKGGSGGGDLLQLMLEGGEREGGMELSQDQILIEIMQLLVAGNETSPVALSWTLHLLGRHPGFIDEMRREIDAVFGDGPITFAGLYQLRLTLRVLDEAMRLYPSFWMIDRVALEDDEAEGVRIPAGVTVVPYIYGVHRNPKVWDDPGAFDPSRFEEESRRKRHPFAHIPFGGGPRKCIGSNMAILQMLLVLAAFIRRYDFEPVHPGPVEAAPMMILHPKQAIEMWVRKRS